MKKDENGPLGSWLQFKKKSLSKGTKDCNQNKRLIPVEIAGYGVFIYIKKEGVSVFAFGSLCVCKCLRRGKFKFIDGPPYIHLGTSRLFLDRVSSKRNLQGVCEVLGVKTSQR